MSGPRQGLSSDRAASLGPGKVAMQSESEPGRAWEGLLVLVAPPRLSRPHLRTTGPILDPPAGGALTRWLRWVGWMEPKESRSETVRVTVARTCLAQSLEHSPFSMCCCSCDPEV